MLCDIEDIGEKTGLVERFTLSLLDVPSKIACVVFLRGCSIKCKDCHNCALQDATKGGQIMTASSLANLLNKKKLPEWICFQGGEPLDQLEFVINVVTLLDSRFNVAIYTGNNPQKTFKKIAPQLLAIPCVKMLKAGPFIQAKRVYGHFLATSNQELYSKNQNGDWIKIDWLNMNTDELCAVF
jgi:organic radical activating enzyme